MVAATGQNYLVLHVYDEFTNGYYVDWCGTGLSAPARMPSGSRRGGRIPARSSRRRTCRRIRNTWFTSTADFEAEMTAADRAKVTLDLVCGALGAPYPNILARDIIAAAIREAVAEERAKWVAALERASGALADVGLAPDLDETGRRNKALHHHKEIAALLGGEDK